MRWEECIRIKMVEKRTKDKELAKSLLKIASERFDFFSSKPLSMFTLEGIYESIIELCHAVLALEGFKTLSHECAIEFLRGKYIDDYETEFLHKLRKKRHGVKYYGKIISEEVIKENLEKGRSLFLKLRLKVEKELKIKNKLK
ncbi:MAG: hypothetical protein NZ942_00370 [Candidatus Aenigmarchaeota archaeon]|nr:hypothetical protein [Candidatus Aenigmarchaeota archaeon]